MRWRLYDAGLVKRLRSAVKERAARSGVKGFQKRWWGSSRPSGRSGLLFLYLGFVVIRMVMARSEESRGGELVAGSASLAFAGVALQRAKKLRQELTRSFERIHSFFYPIAEREFIERTFWKAAAGTWWLVIASAAICWLLESGDSAGVWISAGLAGIVEILVVLALVFGLEEHLEVIPRWLPLGFFAMAVAWFFTPQKYAQGRQAWVNVLPTGWVNVVLRRSWPGEEKLGVLCGMAVVSGAVVWLLARRREARLLQEYEGSLNAENEIRAMEMKAAAEKPSEAWGALDEPETEEENEEVLEAVQPLPMQVNWQKQKIDAIGSEWGEEVRQGMWLRRRDWRQMPWVESVVGWWLNEEEKDTVWFLLGGKAPGWSNGWRNSVIALAVGVLLVAVLPSEWRLLGVIAILTSMGMGLPVAGGAWAATSPAWISGKLSPIYGVYPLAYGRASRVMAKVNLLRTVAWLPLGVVLTVVDAKLAGTALGDCFWLATKVLLLWLAWMPIAIAGKFSKGTNDTTMLRARQILVIPVLIIVISALVVLWGVVLITEGPASLMGAVVAVVASVGIWAAYGWWYNRKVDLLRDRQ